MSEENRSYKQIIKSTSIFGGSQVITIIVGILRNKILAILLGTIGIGLIGIYQTILDLVKSLSAFGIEATGVREIASVKEDDQKKLQETVSVIDRLSFILACIGMFLCIALSYPISLWAFDSDAYCLQISLLGIPTFFSILAAGQTVVLHGLRRISDMVKSTISSITVGFILSLPLYYFWGIDGIIPAFIIASLTMYLVALHYRHKVKIKAVRLPLKTISERSKHLFRVGFFIVTSSIITTAGYFLIRSFLSRDMGLNSVGLFQAAWSITNVYLMLILKSMGSDFYPRLCSIISDRIKTNKLVNEQTLIVLIISTPLIITLFLFSKIALTLLYSSEFSGATALLNWQILGTFFKVLSWPLGFILLAKRKGLLFFISETMFMLVYLFFSHLLYSQHGLEAVGIAYLIAYFSYLFTVYLLGIKQSDFRWNSQNIKITFTSLILILSVFYISQYHREYIIICGVPVFIISLIYSTFKLNQVLPIKSIKHFFDKKGR